VGGVLIPVVIIVVIAIPVLIMAFRATQKSKAAGEHPVPEDAATRQRTEDEFAQAEAYQEQWREEENKHPRDTII
jgi:uncharacterized membrane protein